MSRLPARRYVALCQMFGAILIAVLLGLPLATTTFAQDPGANEMCPVRTDRPVNAAIFVRYRGEKVYFCCDTCRNTFLANPAVYAASIVRPEIEDAVVEEPEREAAEPETSEPEIAAPVEVVIDPPVPAVYESDEGAPTLQVEPVDATPASTSADKLLPWRIFAGRMHPLLVHFPIALLLTAFLIEFVRTLAGRPKMATTTVICLILGTVGALAAAFSGWTTVEVEPRSARLSDLIEWHRWIGVGALGTATVAMVLATMSRAVGWSWACRTGRLLMLPMVGLLVWGAHYGGSITHGEGYLLEAFRMPEPTGTQNNDPVIVSNAELENAREASGVSIRTVDFAVHVRPILAANCFDCHGERRKKGGLRLDTEAGVFTENPDEWVVQPGKPDASELLRRVTLPDEHPKFMPASGDPLTEEQIETVRTWIAEGAHWSTATTDSSASNTTSDTSTPVTSDDHGDAASSGPLEEPRIGVETTSAAEREAATAAIERLTDRGALALPVAANSEAMYVNFSALGESFSDDDLALLDGLQPLLAWLNLAGTAVTDDGVASLGEFTQLRRVHLERTAVGDAGAAVLASLQNLEYLNLYGTQVTDAALDGFASLPRLEKLYLWQSQVTDDGVAKLAAARPGLDIQRGANFTAIVQDDEAEEEEVADDAGEGAEAGG